MKIVLFNDKLETASSVNPSNPFYSMYGTGKDKDEDGNIIDDYGKIIGT
jgi:hypothetical protein